MKKYLLLICLILPAFALYAQPEDVGQAGGMQLSINSWARSSGLMGMNGASVDGIESNGINPAGLATTNNTELVFSSTRWLIGSDVNINTFGFSQKLGDGGSVIGLTVNSFSLGDIVLRDIEAAINPAMQGRDVLLGMSALRELEIRKADGVMTLVQ